MDIPVSAAVGEFTKLIRMADRLAKRQEALNVLVSKLTPDQRRDYWKATEEINQRW